MVIDMSGIYGMHGDFIDCNVKVERRKEESDSDLIDRFITEVNKSGIKEQAKKNKYFTKDSKKRRMERRRRESKNG